MSLSFPVGRHAKAILSCVPFPILLLIFVSASSLAWAESFTFSTPAGIAGQPPTLGTTGDGTNSGAHFKDVSGVSIDANTNVYLTDAHALRRMSRVGTNWVVTTLAGNIDVHLAQDGTNSSAGFNKPQGVAVDSSGTLFVADTFNHMIRRVVPSGTNWVVTTIAGALTPAWADGSNSFALFNQPSGIAVDASGTVFVADSGNHVIRKIVQVGTNWVVTTIAGSPQNSGALNGTNTGARFNAPIGIALDNSGNFYVADSNNHLIRKGTLVGTNWVVSTPAGSPGAAGSVDGTNSVARFSFPLGLCSDSSGNLYLSDNGNNTIRKIKLIGTNYIVNTLAGLAGMPGSTNGTGSAARFNSPNGLAINGAGLFVADSENNIMRNGQVAALLDYRLTGGKFIASWPLAIASAGYIPESSSTPRGAWTPQTASAATNGDTCFLTNNGTAGAAFYRLHKP